MSILKRKEMVVTQNHLILNYKKAPIFFEATNYCKCSEIIGVQM